MKHISFIIALFMPLCMVSQTITEKKVDDFTGEKIVSLSWERFMLEGWGNCYYSFKKIGEKTYLKLKLLHRNEVFAISENAELMLKLADGKVVTLLNSEYVMTSRGGAYNGKFGDGTDGQGLQARFLISTENIKLLQNNLIKKVRVYTTDGYIDAYLREKQAKTIPNAAKLILNSM